MVETDRAVAFVMDDILLASLVAGSKEPGAYVISKDAFSKPEPYGIMLRKDDVAFKKVVDAATAALYKSPEGQKLYDKWFMQKIPPKGLNLNSPIGPELKHEFAKPSDSPDPIPTRRCETLPLMPGCGRCMSRFDGVALAHGKLCELSLELAHFLGAGPERDRQLSRHAAVRARSDDRDCYLRLDHCAGVRVGHRRDADAAVKNRVLDWICLRRVFPQHAAIGAIVYLVLRFAGTVAARVGAVAQADAQRAILYRGDRRRPVHVGACRRANPRRHQFAAARTKVGRDRAGIDHARRPIATCCCRWRFASSCRR